MILFFGTNIAIMIMPSRPMRSLDLDTSLEQQGGGFNFNVLMK